MKTRFNKENRSTFPYWFAHWCAFQLTALNLGAWKFKYLFHDWYKPWLRLFCKYETVAKFHKTHSTHHRQYKGRRKMDWEAMVIDWECSPLTKAQCPEGAYDIFMKKYQDLKPYVYPILQKFNLIPEDDKNS